MVLRTSPSSDTVAFECVAVVRRTEHALTCSIKDRTVSIELGMIARGSTVLQHDTGTLVLARWRAQEFGLIAPAT